MAKRYGVTDLVRIKRVSDQTEFESKLGSENRVLRLRPVIKEFCKPSSGAR